MPSQNAIVPTALISQKIFFVRGTRVMLDADLARLYAVATKNLNKAVNEMQAGFLLISCFNSRPRNYEVWGSSLEPEYQAEVAVAMLPMLSPSKVLRCFPACSAVRVPFT